MIRTFLVFALVGLPVVAVADEPAPAPVADPAFESAPPPPGLNEPGVPATADVPGVPAAAAAPQVDPETVALPMPDTRPVRDRASRTDKTRAEIEASSDSVNERTEGSDTIWEYRKDGKLRMVRVQPRTGPEQIYVDGNGDGRLDRDSVEGPVSPVYFTLYEWN